MRATTLAALLVAACLGGCIHLPDAAHTTNATDGSDGAITEATPLPEIIRKRHVQPLDPNSATPLLDQAMVELAKTDPWNRFRGVT